MTTKHADNDVAALGSTSSRPPDRRFTPAAQEIMGIARKRARLLSCTMTGTEHLMIAILEVGSSNPSHKLSLLDKDASSLADILASMVTPGSQKIRADTMSPSLSRAISIALVLARRSLSKLVDPYLLLAGILTSYVKDGVSNAACRALEHVGRSPKQLLQSMWEHHLNLLSKHAPTKRDFACWLEECVPRRNTAETLGWRWCDEYEILASNEKSGQDSFVGALGTDDSMYDKNQFDMFCVDADAYASPLDNTHWLFPRKLLCGHSAGQMSDLELRRLVQMGVNTFVCLQTSYDEYGVRDYRHALRQLYPRGICRSSSNSSSITFLHCPIDDFSVLNDTSLVSIIAELQRIITDPGRILYVHCMGGHGRTGTVCISLLAAVEGRDVESAIEEFRRRHRSRRGCHGDCRHKLPEAKCQSKQLHATTSSMKRQHKIATKSVAHTTAGQGISLGTIANGSFKICSLTNREYLYCGRNTLDESRRFALCWIGGGDVEGADGVWNFEPLPGTSGAFRIRNYGNGEILYCGSNKYDKNLRYACTWIGGGDVKGDAGIWDLEAISSHASAHGSETGFKIRNRLYRECLCTDRATLDSQRRFTMTCKREHEPNVETLVWSICKLR